MSTVEGSQNDHGDFVQRESEKKDESALKQCSEVESAEAKLDYANQLELKLRSDSTESIPRVSSAKSSSADSGHDDNENVVKSHSSSESQASSFEIVGDSVDPTDEDDDDVVDVIKPNPVDFAASQPEVAESAEAKSVKAETTLTSTTAPETAPETASEITATVTVTVVPIDSATVQSATPVDQATVQSATPVDQATVQSATPVDQATVQSATPVDQAISVDVCSAEEDSDAGVADDEAEDDTFLRQMAKVESLDEIELPVTVKRLKTKHGTRIFLVGTAHFSVQSHDDVSTTIRAVEPDVVMVELCDARKSVLSMDEETILRESKGLDAAKIMEFIKQNGVLQGISHVLLLNLSEQITKQLGMAPGGEFRRAFKETKLMQERKKCQIYLGDRPVGVTLKRALGMLTVWQKVQLCWSLLTEKLDVSKEEVEKMKEKDMLETLLQEMAKDYPTLSQVFVQERDVWLAYALNVAEAMAVRAAESRCIEGEHHVMPSVVVGVVGMGHQPGIVEEWKKLEDSHMTYEERQSVLMSLVRIPPPSAASKILSFGFRAAKLTILLWSCHKIYKWIYP